MYYLTITLKCKIDNLIVISLFIVNRNRGIMDRIMAQPVQRSFGPIDSIVFIGMLGISALVGIYQWYASRKKPDAVGEYLVGSQQMSVFPISMSLIAR